MPRVIHFEINADEPDRAIKFYTNVFQSPPLPIVNFYKESPYNKINLF